MINNLNLLIVGCGKIAKLDARILKEQFKQHQIYRLLVTDLVSIDKITSYA